MLSTTSSTINLQDNFLVLENKRFHYIWLRHHCLCSQCCDAWSGQKIYDINSCTNPPQPLSVTRNDKNLIIDWQEDPQHQSVFPISWLLNHAYDPEPNPNFEPEYILWDTDWLRAHPPQQHDFSNCNPETWMNQLYVLGFTLIKNVPHEALESFLTLIGPIREYARDGKFSILKSVRPSSEYACSDLGSSSNELIPHNDIVSWDASPIVGALYCVENTTSGGESILIDGFKMAEDLRREEPEHFSALTEILVDYWHYFDCGSYLMRSKKPLIELNRKDEVVSIYYSYKNMNINLPFDQIQRFYEALSVFMGYVRSQKYQYNFRIQAGDCLLFNNSRMLHGRKSFDPSTGFRYLETAAVEWDYLRSLLNLKHLQHPAIEGLSILNTHRYGVQSSY
ncbi:MAG: taurine catabolism dioxygenase TauD [Moorea sp. SIO3C2]|nr:taurine catabolism dioxygenase TauD [Moorena sp. SIO3C2]